jgi:hypothetical protein
MFLQCLPPRRSCCPGQRPNSPAVRRCYWSRMHNHHSTLLSRRRERNVRTRCPSERLPECPLQGWDFAATTPTPNRKTPPLQSGWSSRWQAHGDLRARDSHPTRRILDLTSTAGGLHGTLVFAAKAVLLPRVMSPAATNHEGYCHHHDSNTKTPQPCRSGRAFHEQSRVHSASGHQGRGGREAVWGVARCGCLNSLRGLPGTRTRLRRAFGVSAQSNAQSSRSGIQLGCLRDRPHFRLASHHRA